VAATIRLIVSDPAKGFPRGRVELGGQHSGFPPLIGPRVAVGTRRSAPLNLAQDYRLTTTIEARTNVTALVGRDAERAVVDAELDPTRAPAHAGSRSSATMPAPASRRGSTSCWTAPSLAVWQPSWGRVDDDDRRVASTRLRLALPDRLVNETSPRLEAPAARTIEVYPGRIFRRVGCSSRLELALAVNSGRLGVR